MSRSAKTCIDDLVRPAGPTIPSGAASETRGDPEVEVAADATQFYDVGDGTSTAPYRSMLDYRFTTQISTYRRTRTASDQA